MMGTISPPALARLPLRVRALLDGLLGARFRSALMWLTLGSVVARASIVVAMMACARILGQSDFGQLVLLISSTQLLQIFLSVGLGSTVIRFVAGHRTNDPERAGRVLALVRATLLVTSILAAATVAAAGPSLSRYLFAGAITTPMLWLAFGYVLMLAWAELQSAILSGLEEFRRLACLQLVIGPVTFLAVIGGAASVGVAGAIGGLAAGAFVQLAVGAALSALALRQHDIPQRLTWSRAELSVLPQYAMPALLNAVIWLPPIWLTNYLLTRQPNGYAELGLFGAANQWFLALNFLPLMAGRATFPIMASLAGASSQSKSRDLLRRGVQVASLSVLLPAVVLIALSPQVMLIYGDDFAQGWPVMAIMCITAVIASSNGTIQSFMIAHSRPWITANVNVVWAATLMLVAQILTTTHHALGLALAYMVAHGVKTALLLVAAGSLTRSLPQASESDGIHAAPALERTCTPNDT